MAVRTTEQLDRGDTSGLTLNERLPIPKRTQAFSAKSGGMQMAGRCNAVNRSEMMNPVANRLLGSPVRAEVSLTFFHTV